MREHTVWHIQSVVLHNLSLLLASPHCLLHLFPFGSCCWRLYFSGRPSLSSSSSGSKYRPDRFGKHLVLWPRLGLGLQLNCMFSHRLPLLGGEERDSDKGALPLPSFSGQILENRACALPLVTWCIGRNWLAVWSMCGMDINCLQLRMVKGWETLQFG